MSSELNNTTESVFDFSPIGEAIKKAREAKGLTREELSAKVDRSVRHLSSIENNGQYPSFDLLVRLMILLDISLDQYVFPAVKSAYSSERRKVDALLDHLDDRELAVIEATAKGLIELNGRH